MALTAGSNWGELSSRFMSTLKGKAAIVPVNQDTLAFASGGYDPYNSGANFDGAKFYSLGSSSGDHAYKPVYETKEAKDELDVVVKKRIVLTDASVELEFHQDPESFLVNNLTTRFLLIYREAVRDDDMVKYRVCPKVIFEPGEITIPSGGDYATYPVTVQVEENAVAVAFTYRSLADIYAQDLLVAANASKKLYWSPEFGSSFKLADLAAVTGAATYVAAADNAAVTVAVGKRTGTITGKFVIQDT